MQARALAVLSAGLGLFGAGPGVGAATNETGAAAVAAAVAGVRADIASALEELNAWQASDARERAPAAAALAALTERVRTRREEAVRLRQARRLGERELADLNERVQAEREACRFVHGLLMEYRRAMEVRADRAESGWLAPQLAEADEALRADERFESLPRAAAELLRVAAAWNAAREGGMAFDGAALDASGVEHAGRFAVFGPLTYFSAAAGAPAGVAAAQLGSTRAVAHARPDDPAWANVPAVVAGGEAVVPVDVSGGDALRVAASRDTLAGHLRKGGVVMVPLLAVGAIAVLLALHKALDLALVRARGGAALGRVTEALGRGDEAGALAASSALGRPLGAIVAEGIAHRHAVREQLEELLAERVLSCGPRLERNLGTLAVLGGVAPLLGLLGTVTGMIHTFQLVTVFGTGNARLLSGGISEALVTTEVGLAIAIPVLIVHALLARRARVLEGQLEDSVAAFVRGLPAEVARG